MGLNYACVEKVLWAVVGNFTWLGKNVPLACEGLSFEKLFERERSREPVASVITSKAANGYQFKTGQRMEHRDQFLLRYRLLWRQVSFGSIATLTKKFCARIV
jgi:hypothetical protein